MEGFCATNKKLLNWSGYWFEGDAVKLSQKIECLLCLLITIIVLVFPEFYYMFLHKSDAMDLSRVISESLTNYLCIFKMIFFYKNKEKIRVLINDMKNAWNHIDISDIEAKDIKTSSVRRAELVSKVFGYSYLGFATNFMLNPLITKLIYFYATSQEIKLENFSFPIRITYPFQMKTDFLRYTGIFSLTVTCELIALIILMGFDTLTIALMNYCGDFFKILAVPLKSLKLVKEEPQKVFRILKEVVIKHNQYMNLTNRLEDILNVLMLIQYLLSTFMFCIVGFQLSIILETPYDFSMLMTYCVCLYTQLFLFSWFGSYLTTASSDVSFAAYDSEWYNMPMIQRHIVLVIQRSQRELGITAAKFYIISIESYATALSSAISYFTLLQTIYQE